MAQVANLQIAVDQVADASTRVFAAINGGPLTELKVVAQNAAEGVARLVAPIGAALTGEIHRVNSLGHAVITPFAATVSPPAPPHATPKLSVESYADDAPASPPTEAAAAAKPAAKAPTSSATRAAAADVQKA